MKKILLVAALGLVVIAGASARTLKGQGVTGITFEADMAGGRNSPISAEMCKALEDAYGEPIIIVVVEADNTNGNGEYWTGDDGAIADTSQKQGLTPINVMDAKFSKIPEQTRRMFFYASIAKGQKKTFARAFPAGDRAGSKSVKRLQIRRNIVDEWTDCN